MALYHAKSARAREKSFEEKRRDSIWLTEAIERFGRVKTGVEEAVKLAENPREFEKAQVQLEAMLKDLKARTASKSQWEQILDLF